MNLPDSEDKEFSEKQPLEILAFPTPWSACIEIMVRRGTYIGIDIILAHHEPGAICEPTLKLKKKEAQALMDNLWQCGLRPSEGTGSAGSLRATEKHLEDMRVIVSNKLDVEFK